MMNDTQKNLAFQEFLQKRSEEIALQDSMYMELSKESIAAYNNLMKALIEFTNTSTKFQAYAETLMFEKGMCTAQKNAQNKTTLNYDEITGSYKVQNAIK